MLDKTTMLMNIFYMFVVYFFNQNTEHHSLPAFINMMDIANTKYQMFSKKIFWYIMRTVGIFEIPSESRDHLPYFQNISRHITFNSLLSFYFFFNFLKCETSLYFMHLLSFSLNHQQNVHLRSVVLQDDSHRRTQCYDHIWVRLYMSDLLRLYWSVWLNLGVVT